MQFLTCPLMKNKAVYLYWDVLPRMNPAVLKCPQTESQANALQGILILRYKLLEQELSRKIVVFPLVQVEFESKVKAMT